MNTFGKDERLCSRLLIDKLHQEGHRMMAFPYSVRYMEVESLPADVPCQVLIVAPKRKLHHAVDRNRAKRLTRELYRLRKSALYDLLNRDGRHLMLSLSYIHTEVMDYHPLAKRADKLFAQLAKALCASDPSNSSAEG